MTVWTQVEDGRSPDDAEQRILVCFWREDERAEEAEAESMIPKAKAHLSAVILNLVDVASGVAFRDPIKLGDLARPVEH
jgi:hypothetical protein